MILVMFIFSSFLAKANDTTITQSLDSHAVAHNEHVEHVEHADKPFDPTEVIFEHISDAHEWHLWGDHHNPVSISLPVILYTRCFNSF